MSKKTVIGRSDLLVFDSGIDESDMPSLDMRRKAALLGYEYEAKVPANNKKPEQQQGPWIEDKTSVPTLSKEPAPLVDIPFLCPREIELITEAKAGTESLTSTETVTSWRNKPKMPPKSLHFSSRKLLEKWLLPYVAPQRKLRRLDIPKVVKKLAEGRPLQKLPRKQKRRLAHSLQVVLDRSPHLIPYWNMQFEILHCLHVQEYGEVHIFTLDAVSKRFIAEREDRVFYADPDPDKGPLLVLSDLGAFSGEVATVRSQWTALSRSFCQSGAKPFVFFPGSFEAFPQDYKRFWNVISAETGTEAEPHFELVEYLLTLASPANRLEPGLLSHLRQAMVPSAGISLDIRAWNQTVVEQPSSLAASWSSLGIRKYRARFAHLPAEIQRKAIEIIRHWRWDLPDEIYFEELLNLPAASKDILSEDKPFQSDLANARAYFDSVSRGWRKKLGQEGVNLRAWLLRVGDRAQGAWQEDALCRAVTEVKRSYEPDYNPPVSPDKIDRPDVNVEVVDLRLSGKGIDVQVAGTTGHESSGSPLARLPSKNGVVELGAWRASDHFSEKDFWQADHAPAWADDWGVDEFGPWAAFSIVGHDVQTSEDGRLVSNNVVRESQVLRWIPPGQFPMGSPADEAGRWEDEGPQHNRHIEKGLWLFDTAVTQGLWQAVMENNPSEFKGADRPVETVSWDEAREFIDRLNKNLPGLDLDLPSEAEWEFACRADVADATYAGALSMDNEKSDHAVLDKIAWYSKNSDDGTSPVAQKEPNPFGLYDMLGNVEEWCADEWHDSYEGAPSNGSVWQGVASVQDSDGRALRVFRGGSWGGNARGVRSACRDWSVPSNRYYNLGFRCAVRSGELRQEARSAASRLSRPVTRGQSRVEQDGALPALAFASEIDLEQPKPKRVVVDNNRPLNTLELSELPRRRMRIRTDKAVLTLESMTKPEWANALGRDRFGLYADLKVENVTQKLRWIPPGGFLMGSPEGEPGRDDDEGPRHYVTIGSGFWLFNTPVTQDLWEAVMGDNPSEYVHPDRPVENVDWDQAQSFATALSDRVPALMFELPSESEWEYACRAGTANATYAGPTKIVGERNAPALDEIAWYGGNSGQEFDLETGYDTSGWKEKQYPEDVKAGTRIVGLKKPNPFGLFDMLGNVLEWCADEWHESYDGAPENGAVWHGQASQDERDGRALRVFRGGSWNGDARRVRSAFRDGDEPSLRSSALGFRCAVRSVELGQAARSAGIQEAGLARDARAQPRGSGQIRAGGVGTSLPSVANLSENLRLSDINDTDTENPDVDNADRGKS